jgi:hypothetical protein
VIRRGQWSIVSVAGTVTMNWSLGRGVGMERNTKRWILWVARFFVLVIYVILLAYAVIVGIAFVLKLLGANPEADFADWIYSAAASITEPFRGIFPTRQLTDRSTFDASLLFALIVYLVLAVVLHGIIDWCARKIAGIDRAEEREQLRAAYDLQRSQEAAVFGGEVPPGAVEPAPSAPSPTYPWDQPPVGAAPVAPPPGEQPPYPPS